jgi:hypothetical protein
VITRELTMPANSSKKTLKFKLALTAVGPGGKRTAKTTAAVSVAGHASVADKLDAWRN